MSDETPVKARSGGGLVLAVLTASQSEGRKHPR
jgi:hypothetical protein